MGSFELHRESIEVVANLVFFGAKITADGRSEEDLRRRIALGKSAMVRLTKIWKGRHLAGDKETISVRNCVPDSFIRCCDMDNVESRLEED